MPDLFSSRRLGWAFLTIFLAIWFFMLGARTLVPTDEARYAELPREMAVTGDYVTPRLNGIKYFYKPPLQYWTTALTFEAFGVGEWQARLWTGLTGLLGIWLVWAAARRLWGREAGLASAMVLGASFYWAAMGHINSLDMGLSGMMALALCGLLIAQDPRTDAAGRRNWMLACWAGMALAVLSKGLIGLVLPGAVLVLYTLLSRDWGIWTRLHLGKGLVLFFAITAPWFILVSLKNPEFPHYFFIHEHFERFTSKVHRRPGPWYYFLPFLAIGILPWLSMLAQGLWEGVRGDRREGRQGFQPRLMLLVWAAFIFVFFSISKSKLPSYILPVFPALAMLLALYLLRAGRLGFGVAGALMALTGVAGLALTTRLPHLGDDALEREAFAYAIPGAIAASLILLAAGAAVVGWARRPRSSGNLTPIALLAAGGFLAGQVAMLASEDFGRQRAGMHMIPTIQAELAEGGILYGFGQYEQAMPFYLGRPMRLVLHPDELEFGLQQEPQLWLPRIEDFAAEWTNGKKALAIVHPQRWPQFIAANIPYRIIAQDSRRILVANDPK